MFRPAPTEAIAIRSDRPESLQFNMHMLALVRSVAFLRQHKKEVRTIDNAPTALVDVRDYAIVYDLLQRAHPQDIDQGVSTSTMDALELIRPHLHHTPRDVYELSDRINMPVPDTRRRVKELVAAGYLVVSSRPAKDWETFKVTPRGQSPAWRSVYSQLRPPETLRELIAV